MFYVPDGTTECGYYECDCCGNKFLALEMTEKTDCPYCQEEVDYEVGTDESMEEKKDTAHLIEVLKGENVEKIDTLLSLAITGGNFDWI